MTKKILIIDDDQQIVDMLKAFLESEDYTVTSALTAEKGLAFSRKESFNLILLDVMLPDGNGLTVLNNLMKTSSNVPVIMITGGSDIETAEKCLQSGAVDYITKPFDFEYLKTTIIANMLGS